MEPELGVFQDFLKKRGLRRTREREAILKEVLSMGDHFDVDELYIRLKKKSAVSRASVYRTIPLLIEAGLITEVYLENGHMHYEHVYGRDHHCHLRCNICRRIIEVSDKRIDEVEKDIAERYGFISDGHKLDITGICPECQGK
jgi:Fur family ferric uptake transcriptional regulator